MRSSHNLLSLLPLLTLHPALTHATPHALLPRQTSETANLLISLPAGSDAATTLQVPLEQTTITNFFNRNAIGAAIRSPASGVFCGGFQDSGATILVGTVFDSTNPAVYGQAGGDATVIGSYWCSRNKMAVERRATSVVSPGGGGNGGGNNNNGGGNNNNNGGGSNNGGNNNNNDNGGGATVSLQIEQTPDQFRGIDVPLNRLVSSADIAQLGDTIIVLDVVRGNGVADADINCQAFSDRAGNQPLGGVATVAEAAMVAQRRTQPAALGAILCADRPLGGGGNNGGGNNGGGGGGNQVRGEVSLQIETASNEFRGTSVPVNQLVTVGQNSQLIGRALRIDVVGADGEGNNINEANIRCQAWADEQGNEPIGRPATVDLAAELSLDRNAPAQFRSITCNA